MCSVRWQSLGRRYLNKVAMAVAYNASCCPGVPFLADGGEFSQIFLVDQLSFLNKHFLLCCYGG